MNHGAAVAAEADAVALALGTGTPAHLARILDPRFIVLDQHALMAYLIAEWDTTPGGRLTISSPPRIGKSWVCMVWAAVWTAARHPGAEIVIACASQTLVNEHGQHIRDIVEAHGPVLGLTPRIGSNRADYVKFTNGSSIRLVGIGSQLTGFGATHLFIDDAFPNWDAAHSNRVVQRVKNWFESVAMTRLYPDARAMHTGTRWSGRDVHSIAEDEGWPGWRIPAIADDPADPLGRAVGEGMITPKKPDEPPTAATMRWRAIEAKRTDILWSTIYQGIPSNKQSLLVTGETLRDRTIPVMPPCVAPAETIVSVDPSTGTGQAHHDTCGIVAAHLGDDARVYLVDEDTQRADVATWAAAALNLARRLGATRVLVEANQGGSALEFLLSTVADGIDWSGSRRPVIELHHATGSKWSRAGENGLAGMIKLDQVRLVGHLDVLSREIREWEPGDESPGSLDAAAHAAIHLLGRPLDRLDADETDGGLTADTY